MNLANKANAKEKGKNQIKGRFAKLKGASPMVAMAYLYLTLPVLIFVIGWCRPIIAILISAVILISLFLAITETRLDWEFPWSVENMSKMLLVLALIFFWVVLSGIGKGVYQNDDQPVRNGLFEMLINQSWPVTKLVTIDGVLTNKTLVYYIGFWLPSAVIGKLFGVDAGYRFQMLWAVLGIFTMYYLLCAWRRKVMIWPLLVLIFFSGLDSLAILLMNSNDSLDFIWGIDHLERWGAVFQYSSMTTQLFWVFNQAVPSWLAVMLIWNQRNRRSLVLILSTVMLNATLPFIGLIPIVIYFFFAIREEEGQSPKKGIVGWIRHSVKEIVTFQNVCGGGVIGLLSFAYLRLNGSGAKGTFDLALSIGVKLQNAAVYVADIGDGPNLGALDASKRPVWGTMIILFGLFLLFEFMIYLCLLYQKEKKNPLYYLIFLLLCIIPFGRVGGSIDFCMRASIPSLFIVLLMIIRYLDEAEKGLALYLMIAMLLIGAVTPLHEIKRTIVNTMDRNFDIEVSDEESLLKSGNFSGVTEGSIFGDYIMK